MQLNQTNPDYSSVLYLIPLPSWIYELETFQILDVNQAAIDHYGYSKTDFLRLTVKDICLENEIPHLITLHSEIEIHAGNFSLGVFTHHKRSGDQIRVKIKGQKITYQGRASILAVAQDVTEEENRIEQLKVSEERFRITQEISPDGFTILRPLRDENGEVVDFTWVFENQAIADINNTDPDAVIGKRLLELFPTHQDTAILDSYRYVANTRKSKILEEVYVGEIVSVPTWLRLVIVPMGDDIAILNQNITDRKMAQEAVRDSEARFRTIFEIASLGIAQVDPSNGQIILVNTYYETITGYSIEELQTMNFVNLTHPDDREKDWELFSKAARGEGEYRNEKRYIRKDGNIVWVRIHVAFIRDQVGKPIRTVAICEEITDRKEAEANLEKAYREKNSILERIGDAFFALDKDWKVTYWNKRAEEIIGVPREDLIGNNLWEKFPLAKELEFFKQYERAFKTQTPVNFEEYFQPFNQWYEANGYPSPEGISVFFRDVTEKKIAEKKILTANERFEKVTEATNDAIWDYDVLTNDLFWGMGFHTLFGYIPDEIKPSFDVLVSLIHEEDRAHIISQVNKYMTDPSLINWFEEYRFLKADGSYAFVIDRAKFIRNSEGKVIRVIGAMNDITERKDFEQQLTTLNKSLKQYAHDLELSNEQLEQFAFIASHDLQEPLRMISSFMDQLKRKYKDQLDEKAHQYIHFASDGAKRMKQIILDLLEYSRAGRLAEARETVDLNDLLNEYQLLRRKFISEKSVKFDMNNLPVLRCFKAPMTQTLHSLLDNAINYSKPGVAPRITITSEEMGGFCKISIADNGIGIESEFFEKIFIIFQRLHNREKYDGTGIGLSIAKKNIESWGGKIWLESTPGEGSTFFFTIPKLK